MQTETKGFICSAVSAVLFGIAPLGTKYFMAGGGTPMYMVFLRAALTIVPFYLLGRWQRQSYKVNKRQLLQLIVLSVFGITATVLTLNMSYLFIPIGMATTIHFAYPVLVLLFGAMFFKSKITYAQAVCALLCTAGILLFYYTPSAAGSVSLQGVAAAFVSACTFAFYVLYLAKSGLAELHPFVLGCYVSIFVALSSGLGLVVGGVPAITLPAFFAAAAVAMGAAFCASALFQVGVQFVGPQTAALLSVLEPVTGIAVGIFFLKEPFTTQIAMGAACIIAGVILLTRQKRNAV